MAELIAATLFEIGLAGGTYGAGSLVAANTAAFIAANAAVINTVALVTASPPLGRPVWRPALLPAAAPTVENTACHC